VIAGKDGPINEKAKSALARLQTLARLCNDNYDTERSVDIKICRHCDKTEMLMEGAKLMCYQRCKVAYYCKRECQVADWKSHKKMCNAISSSTVSHSAQKTIQTTMWAFIASNYFDIAKEVYKKTQEYNVPKKELLVEIDFFEDTPALRIDFKIWLTSSLFEGSSVADVPDWVRTIVEDMRAQRGPATSDHLVAVCRASSDQVNNHAFNLISMTGCDFLSDEAVESIG
jgi:hypothetical protein